MQYFINLRKFSLSLLLLVISCNASAEIVQYKFSAIVDGLRGNYHTLEIGDNLTFTVDFDSSSGKYFKYIYDFGQTSQLICTQAEAATNNECNNILDNLDFADNIDIAPSDFSHLFNFEKLGQDNGSLSDTRMFKRNYVFGEGASLPSYLHIKLQDDFVSFYNTLISGENHSSSLTFHYMDSLGSQQLTTYDFTSINSTIENRSVSVTNVDEPSVKVLLLMGLILISARIFGKNNK